MANKKINLHQADDQRSPYAKAPIPGSTDLCFIVDESIENILQELNNKNIVIEMRPIARTGSSGSIISLYIRGPDKNLIELSNYT